jgi:phage terminase small subunit
VADLTVKQDAFCQLYVELGNASEAYRQAYSSKAKQQSVAVEACKLLSSPNVALRVDQLRKELEEASMWSRVDSLKVLSEIAKGQDDEAKPSDKVNAVKVINSMHGWDKQVIEQNTTHHMSESLAERLTGGSKR